MAALEAEPLTIRAELPLTAIAALIEGSPAGALRIDEPDLAPSLCTRLALTTLRRRADQRGKTLILAYRTQPVRALAQSAGWGVVPLPARAARPERSNAGRTPGPAPEAPTANAPVGIARSADARPFSTRRIGNVMPSLFALRAAETAVGTLCRRFPRLGSSGRGESAPQAPQW